MDKKYLENYLQDRRNAREASVRRSLKSLQSSSELRIKHQQRISQRAEFRYFFLLRMWTESRDETPQQNSKYIYLLTSNPSFPSDTWDNF